MSADALSFDQIDNHFLNLFNPGLAEPKYTLPLQTV